MLAHTLIQEAGLKLNYIQLLEMGAINEQF